MPHDTVRITIPVAVHSRDEDALALRKAVASWVARRAQGRGLAWEVTQRVDTGVVIVAPFERPAGGNTITSTAGVLVELERIVNDARLHTGARALFDAVPRMTIKTNGG